MSLDIAASALAMWMVYTHPYPITKQKAHEIRE
jgi:hypothetical protein